MANALAVYIASRLMGESTIYNRLFGGALAESSVLTASTLVKTGEGICYGAVVTTTLAAAWNIHDNTTNTGNPVAVLASGLTAGTVVQFPAGVHCLTGIYVYAGGAGRITLLYL